MTNLSNISDTRGFLKSLSYTGIKKLCASSITIASDLETESLPKEWKNGNNSCP